MGSAKKHQGMSVPSTVPTQTSPPALADVTGCRRPSMPPSWASLCARPGLRRRRHVRGVPWQLWQGREGTGGGKGGRGKGYLSSSMVTVHDLLQPPHCYGIASTSLGLTAGSPCYVALLEWHGMFAPPSFQCRFSATLVMSQNEGTQQRAPSCLHPSTILCLSAQAFPASPLPPCRHLVPFSTGPSCLSSTTLLPSCAFSTQALPAAVPPPHCHLCLFLPRKVYPRPCPSADLRPSGYPTYRAPDRSCVRQSRPFAANCTHVLLGSFASLSECLCSAVRWRAGEAGDTGTTTGSPKQPGALCYQPNTATWKKPLLWALWLHGMEWWNDGEWWRYMKGHPEVLRGHVSSHFSAGNAKPPQKQPGQELLWMSCFEISLSAFKSLGQHLEIRLDFCLDSISHIFYWDSYLSKLL